MVDRAPAAGADAGVIADVSDAPATVSALAELEATLGPVDGLVTAAGYYEAAHLTTLTPDRWRRMLAVHVLGTVNAWQAVLPGMLHRRNGSIVAIGSELALCGDPAAPHYAAAKGAIHALVKSVGAEVAPRGVRVNCVAPGPTDTPLLANDPNTPGYAASLPLGRLIQPQEIAGFVTFLLLEHTNIVGQVISPNAGAVP